MYTNVKTETIILYHKKQLFNVELKNIYWNHRQNLTKLTKQIEKDYYREKLHTFNRDPNQGVKTFFPITVISFLQMF